MEDRKIEIAIALYKAARDAGMANAGGMMEASVVMFEGQIHVELVEKIDGEMVTIGYPRARPGTPQHPGGEA